MENHEEKVSRREKAAKIKRRRQREQKKLLFICVIVIVIALVLILSGKLFKNDSKGDDIETQDITINAEQVDSSKLEDLIKQTKSFDMDVYTKKSNSALKDSVKAAEKLLEGKPKQSEIEEAYFDILDSIYALKEKESKEESSKDSE